MDDLSGWLEKLKAIPPPPTVAINPADLAKMSLDLNWMGSDFANLPGLGMKFIENAAVPVGQTWLFDESKIGGFLQEPQITGL